MGDVLLVTVGSNGYKSSDVGDTWTSVGGVTGGGSQARAAEHAADLGLWVTGSASAGTHVMSAPKTLTPWTQRATSTETGTNINRIRWFPDLNGGYFLGGSEDAVVFGSSNGTSWTNLADLASGPVVRDFAFAPSLDRVVCSMAPGGRLWSAEAADLTTWTERTVGFGANDINGAAWSPTEAVFVVVGGDDVPRVKVSTSTDGISWTSRTAPAIGIMKSVEWVADLSLFVAVGDSGIATSPTGVTWTVRSTVTGFVDLVWAPTSAKVVALTSGGGIYRSSDAVTWTAATTVGAGTAWAIAAATTTLSGWLVGAVPIFA